jgi:hypothetical protein
MNIKKNFLNILLIFLPYYGYGQDVTGILSLISEKDQETIRSLFYTLVISDHFAYTLFGNKPVSLSGDFTITPINNTLIGCSSGGCFWNKWRVWNQYRNLFEINNYILIDEPSEIYKDIHFVVLINKKLFIKTVKENSSLFKKILHSPINPEKMLEDIESNRLSFQQSIKNHELLWGILLGYGKHNAKLYSDRHELLKLKKGGLNSPLSFNEIEKKIDDLNQKLQPFGDHHYSPLILHSVHCVADPSHSETIQLKQIYHKWRGKISAIYAKGDFLTITLSQLTAEKGP